MDKNAFACANGQRAGSFRLGEWLVEPRLGRICRGSECRKVEPKSMDVLVELARARGDVVSKDELVERVWGNRPMADCPIYRCISLLRKALDDDASRPKHIATVCRRGWRLLVEIEEPGPEPEPEPELELREENTRLRRTVARIYLEKQRLEHLLVTRGMLS